MARREYEQWLGIMDKAGRTYQQIGRQKKLDQEKADLLKAKESRQETQDERYIEELEHKREQEKLNRQDKLDARKETNKWRTKNYELEISKIQDKAQREQLKRELAASKIEEDWHDKYEDAWDKPGKRIAMLESRKSVEDQSGRLGPNRWDNEINREQVRYTKDLEFQDLKRRHEKNKMQKDLGLKTDDPGQPEKARTFSRTTKDTEGRTIRTGQMTEDEIIQSEIAPWLDAINQVDKSSQEENWAGSKGRNFLGMGKVNKVSESDRQDIIDSVTVLRSVGTSAQQKVLARKDLTELKKKYQLEVAL